MGKHAIWPVAFLASFVCVQPARAASVDAASCSQADVQSAIDGAGDGDTVNVPAGSCAWAGVSIPSEKGITLAGAGVGATTIDGSAALSVSASASTPTRVTGFTFTGIGTNNDGDVGVSSSNASAPYRIDHNAFENDGQSVFIVVGGNGPGLIDHNTFTGGGASEIIHNVGLGSGDDAGWTDDVTPGGSQMVFIEDNDFVNTDTTYIYSAVQSYYGARTVFRHNTLTFAQVDQHGTAGMVGARWFEIYENTFQPNGLNQCCYGGIRAGSGVVFDNHVVGAPQWGPAGFDFYEEDDGAWPLAYQVGSGIDGHTDQHAACTDKNSSPVYLWGNDANITVGSQTDTKVVEGRDYIVSATKPATLFVQQTSSADCTSTLSYEPYTYPHPLQAGEVPDGGVSGSGGSGSPDGSASGGAVNGGSGGSLGGSAGSAGKATDSSSDDGCGCRTRSTRPSALAILLALAFVGFALGRRRTHHLVSGVSSRT